MCSQIKQKYYISIFAVVWITKRLSFKVPIVQTQNSNKRLIFYIDTNTQPVSIHMQVIYIQVYLYYYVPKRSFVYFLLYSKLLSKHTHTHMQNTSTKPPSRIMFDEPTCECQLDDLMLVAGTSIGMQCMYQANISLHLLYIHIHNIYISFMLWV